MQEEVIGRVKQRVQEEIIVKSLYREFYAKRAENQDKEKSANTKLQIAQLEDDIALNKELLDFIEKQ